MSEYFGSCIDSFWSTVISPHISDYLIFTSLFESYLGFNRIFWCSKVKFILKFISQNMALVIMKFNLYNCMIAAKVILLSCFSLVLTFNLWCWTSLKGKVWSSFRTLALCIQKWPFFFEAGAHDFAALEHRASSSCYSLRGGSAAWCGELTSLHFTCSIMNSNRSSSSDSLGFQSLEITHLKDIKSMCIVCLQEVTITMCI